MLPLFFVLSTMKNNPTSKMRRAHSLLYSPPSFYSSQKSSRSSDRKWNVSTCLGGEAESDALLRVSSKPSLCTNMSPAFMESSAFSTPFPVISTLISKGIIL